MVCRKIAGENLREFRVVSWVFLAISSMWETVKSERAVSEFLSTSSLPPRSTNQADSRLFLSYFIHYEWVITKLTPMRIRSKLPLKLISVISLPRVRAASCMTAKNDNQIPSQWECARFRFEPKRDRTWPDNGVGFGHHFKRCGKERRRGLWCRAGKERVHKFFRVLELSAKVFSLTESDLCHHFECRRPRENRLLRKWTLILFEKAPRNQSIRQKQKKAGWEHNHLLKILQS